MNVVTAKEHAHNHKHKKKHLPVDLLQGHVRSAHNVKYYAPGLGYRESQQGGGNCTEGGIGGAQLALAVTDAHQCRAYVREGEGERRRERK